ncbi:type II secretion system F family protein [Paenibacillus senegalensis]|uniref:type II secretion system F family protein n=1 Tax=Paenibacillus senegalensis TaxID=1465766 RepID=UPI0002887999|nr:type II secretion system F family protein [Paenibacillus senegalensis]
MNSTKIYMWLQPFSLFVIKQFKLMDKMPVAVTRLHLKMVALYGRQATIELTRQFLAQMLTTGLLVFLPCMILALISEDKLTLLVAGMSLAVLFPFIEVKSLDKKVQQRKRSIIIELPEFLSKLTLLVNAGDTVQGALGKCILSKQGTELTPLYKELTVLHNELLNNQSLAKSLEELSKRCALAEVSQFTTTVLLNYRRGGDDFVLALRELTRTLWEKRKALAKTLGEEASSKLVIPMVMTFMIVMIIVAAPAMLIMNF